MVCAMNRKQALALAIDALQKEHRYHYSIGRPFLIGQITQKGTSYHKHALEAERIKKAIELLNAMRRQKEMKL